MEAYQHQKRDFSPNTRPRVRERKFGPQDGLQNAPRSAQDGPKRLLESIFFALEIRLKFALVWGAVLVDFWLPFGTLSTFHSGTFFGLKNDVFFMLCYASLQEAPRAAQEAPRASQEAPKRLQEDFEGFWASFLEVLGHHVGSFLEFSLDMFGLQVLHMSRFMCFFTFLTFLAWGGYS